MATNVAVGGGATVSAGGGGTGGSGAASSSAASAPSSKNKCGSCGSTHIDQDPSRGDAVCMNCGEVLEASLIVSDVQFEENAHGGSSAIGTFVSGDTKGGGLGGAGGGGGGGGGGMLRGGPMSYGGISGIGRESREITLRNARNKIKVLGQQLSLRQDRIEIAFNFFKMALQRNLTRGRKSTHVIAACVYITCRTEATSHMLIDFSDILQIDVYELGRTYLKLAQELCINIPAMDPCLYVLRFAHKLEFHDKTHEVSMTALRLVARMKKDWIHFGRRPSGLCGAALLIAARLHMFHRSVSDVIKVVKVHESTLRKRLNEFGETPASQLTLDEFMNIDLDAMTEEQDPPSFKAARKKDKERLLHLETEGDLDDEINKLETLIEKELLEKRAKLKGPYSKMARESIVPLSPSSTVSGASPRREKDRESLDAEDFIAEQTLATVSEIVESGSADTDLMPPPNRKGIIASPGLGLKDTIQEYLTHPTVPAGSGSAGSNYSGKKEEPGDSNEADEEDDELDLEGIDDDEIDGYIMSESEAKFKTDMWMKVNAEYLKEKAEKEERERKEEEEAIKEGREIKKKKRAVKKPKVNMGGNQTAIEAIEKIVQEKKISTKINYDVLRSLNMLSTPTREATDEESGAGEGPFGKSPADTPTSVGTVFSPALGSDPSSGARRAEEDDSVEPSSSKRFKSDSGKSVSKKEPDSKSSKTNSLSNGKESTSEVVEKVLPIEMQEAIVESGPIEKHVEEEEEEEHFDDEEDIDESCLSASQLLAKHRGDMGEDEDAYNYGEEEEDYY